MEPCYWTRKFAATQAHLAERIASEIACDVCTCHALFKCTKCDHTRTEVVREYVLY
jgi:hypothetical protein